MMMVILMVLLKFSHSKRPFSPDSISSSQVLLEKLEEVLLESLTWNDGWNFAQFMAILHGI